MITVLGASGNVGSKIADRLLAEGKPVKVVARHREKLAEFAKRGAEVCAIDVLDTSKLIQAFKGSDSAFTMIPPNMAAPSMAEHYRRMSRSICRAVSDSGIRKIVNLSSLGAEHDKKTGPVKYLHEHEQSMNQIHRTDMLHLRPAYFMENLLWNSQMIASQGSFAGSIKGTLRMPMIATQDIAEFAAKRLVDPTFTGKMVHDLLGPSDISMNEIAEILSRTLGRKITYQTLHYVDDKKRLMDMGAMEDMADQFIEMNQAFNTRLVSSTGIRGPASTTSTRFEDFARFIREKIEQTSQAA